MDQRINITLPDETLTLIDRLARKGNRSRFIDAAVRHYAGAIDKAALKNQLEEGAIARAARDLSLAEECFVLEEDGALECCDPAQLW